MHTQPMAARGRDEMRHEERVVASLGVALEAGAGVTRDISASGVCFETDATLAVGGTVEFAIDFNSSLGKMELKCRGIIVRADAAGARTQVAVKILESVMQRGSTAA